jgi:hypothetical protein
MGDDIIFRAAGRADIPQLIAIFNAQYARKKNESYFVWQYFETDYPTVLMCAIIDDEIIGTFGIQKRVTNTGASVGQAIDLLIKQDFRGKGIFDELYKQALEVFSGLDILCVLPNRNGRIACEKTLGWKVLAKIDFLALYGVISVAQNYDDYVESINQNLERFILSDSTRKWRFDRNPDYEYLYLSSEPEEYIITKLYRNSANMKCYGDIVYFSCNSDNIRGLKHRFKEASEMLFKHKVSAVTTWALPHTQLYYMLLNLGFNPYPQERYFCVKVFNPTYEYLNEINRWHLVQADAEIY